MPFLGAFTQSTTKVLKLLQAEQDCSCSQSPSKDPKLLGMRQKQYYPASCLWGCGQDIFLAPGHGQRYPGLEVGKSKTPLIPRKGPTWVEVGPFLGITEESLYHHKAEVSCCWGMKRKDAEKAPCACA